MIKNNDLQRKKVVYGIFLFLICIGCSANENSEIPESIGKLKNLTVYPANTSPAENISFRQDVVYGSAKDVLVGEMGNIAVDNSGRVFIADSKINTIHVFGPDAHYLTHIGRKGEGPGEFSRVKDLQINDHKLFAYDLTRLRYHVFSLDSLSFLYTVSLGKNKNDFNEISDAHQKREYVRNNSTFLTVFTKDSLMGENDWDIMETKGLYYLLDKDGNISSQKLMESKNQVNVMVPFPGGATDGQGNYTSIRRMGFHPGFYGKSQTSLTTDNHILWAWTNTFLIKKYSPEGEYQRAIYYPYKKVPLTHESATEAGTSEFILEGMSSMDLPESWPAIQEMLIDDENRLWVSTIVEDFDVYEWWILEETGELITKFDWPRDEPIEVIKNGKMYTRETDEETGLQQVVRYQVEME